ncbi:MAG: site-specific integrase [Patescibacteria group bacterium]
MEVNQQLVKNEFDYSNILSQVKQIFDLLDVSENTREEYKQRIGLFLIFLKRFGFNRNSFLEFKHYLNDKIDYSASTKNKYLATSRIFLKELNRQGLLPTDITQNIKSFSQSKRHKIDGLNDEEISKLITYLQSLSNTNQNTRLKAIFSLLIFQGLRQCEITRLKYQDFDPINHTLFVVGKGRDDKELINLHPETVKNIQLFIKTNHIADGYLLASKSNHNLNNKLSVRGLREIIKTVLSALDINRNVHGFRHYFITKLIKNYKGDLLEVARYTRHRSLEMLQVYNDGIKQKKDLPRYHKTFNEISF